MISENELRRQLKSIDRKSYPAYKSLTGSVRFSSYILSIDHVQGDPFASPSHLTAHIDLKAAGFPEAYLTQRHRRVALADYLLRKFSRQLSSFAFSAKGSGKSGFLGVSRCGEEVLERTACEITDREIAIRFFVGFPAAGRTILAGELEKILFEILPPCIEKIFFYRSLPAKEVKEVIALAEDQFFLRREIRKRGLVAFIADGSVLPRESGVSDRPMKDGIAFESPESLAVTLELPNRGATRGMGIPRGITLIAGGGYHGKSTVLKALERGVYNHIAGDGREYVVTDDSAVKLRAEDGRKITDADISMFIHDLPNKKDTRRFTTPDASGSTSQAANIVEAMEAGSRLFLIDEDTSATNFMIRDDLMQKVIARDKEPITPFLERARDLYEQADISSILVVGSSGAYFYLADRIIQMDQYHPVDITERVRAICRTAESPSLHAPDFHLPDMNRGFSFLSGNARNASQGGRRGGGKYEHAKIKLQGSTAFSLDKSALDLRYLEQLADSEQTAALAHLLRFAMENYKGSAMTCSQIVRQLADRLDKEGLSFLSGSSYTASGLAMPRIQEIFACFFRV